MSEEDLRRVGEPYFQARASYDRRHGGTGLGLSIVKGLVRLHGGELVHSQPGRGGHARDRAPAARLRTGEGSERGLRCSPRQRCNRLNDQSDAALGDAGGSLGGSLARREEFSLPTDVAGEEKCLGGATKIGGGRCVEQVSRDHWRSWCGRGPSAGPSIPLPSSPLLRQASSSSSMGCFFQSGPHPAPFSINPAPLVAGSRCGLAPSPRHRRRAATHSVEVTRTTPAVPAAATIRSPS